MPGVDQVVSVVLITVHAVTYSVTEYDDVIVCCLFYLNKLFLLHSCWYWVGFTQSLYELAEPYWAILKVIMLDSFK